MGTKKIRPEYPFPWGRFFLLWGLALLMCGSLFWLHQGFGADWAKWMAGLALGMPLVLAWAMTRPRWQKVTCSWCGSWGKFLEIRGERPAAEWGGPVVTYHCLKCGREMERLKKP